MGLAVLVIYSLLITIIIIYKRIDDEYQIKKLNYMEVYIFNYFLVNNYASFFWIIFWMGYCCFNCMYFASFLLMGI